MRGQLKVEATGLEKSYGGVGVLSGVDLEVERGTVFALLGPNGAGKTTTVRILATLIRADAGTARVAGLDVVADRRQVRRAISLTGQFAALDELQTGEENLRMMGRLAGLPAAAARRRAGELLERFDLAQAGRRPVATWSGGMRRRLDLAASLVGRPRVLYLDEPTTGLDPRSRRQLWTLINDLVRTGTTVLLTTQYLEEADQLADSIVVVDHGHVIAAGTPDELKNRLGGQVIEVRPRDPADVGRTSEILASLAGTEAQLEQDGQLVVVPVSDSSVLTLTVHRLAEAGIAVIQLALRLPSLDEVFLALTGHTAEAEPSDDVPAGIR